MSTVTGLVDDAASGITELLGLLDVEKGMGEIKFEGNAESDESTVVPKNGRLPLVFWGHSLGAFVALRLAQLLAKNSNISISHLIVSHCRAPQVRTSIQFHCRRKSKCVIFFKFKVQSAFNGSVHTVKLFTSNEREIRLRFVGLGGIPNYMATRMDMLGIYIPMFRAGNLLLTQLYILALKKILLSMWIDHEAFETFTFDDPIPDEVEEETPLPQRKETRANYGWDEDEDDKQWKEPEVIIPYPLHCPVSVFGAMDDERMRPDHAREWTKLSRGNNKCYFCEKGGYYFFKDGENEAFVRSKISDICKAIYGDEKKDAEDLSTDGEINNCENGEHQNQQNDESKI